LFSQVALAGVKVSKINYEKKGNDSVLKIAVEGKSNDLPEISVTGQVLQVNLGEADSFKTINKNQDGVSLTAQSQKGKAVISAKLPFNVKASEVNLGWKNDQVEITFPTGKIIAPKNEVKKVAAVAAAVPAVAKKVAPPKESFNEDYLNKISQQIEKNESSKVVKKDSISTAQSAVEKGPTTNNTFSFAGYAAKFTIFLAI